ncbi:hypothetical protein IQ266_02250 [filamentous cyanobacterium LEGE 11480]|uniref:Uncharacterized protein n=1 Tax=Romeriopsis navalis LEGE 11480 TaxID=2777977 RepID=A0A928Z2X0_9CYAN|nr:hypothetical protein [Romeriopsis navalis]MBE9028578.1 hypothetical protein [Romeriopsis navalis LEGE 11480]
MLIDFLCCAYQNGNILIVQTNTLEQLHSLWPDNRVGAWVIEWFTGIERIHWHCDEDCQITEETSLETYFVNFKRRPHNNTVCWAQHR